MESKTITSHKYFVSEKDLNFIGKASYLVKTYFFKKFPYLLIFLQNVTSCLHAKLQNLVFHKIEWLRTLFVRSQLQYMSTFCFDTRNCPLEKLLTQTFAPKIFMNTHGFNLRTNATSVRQILPKTQLQCANNLPIFIFNNDQFLIRVFVNILKSICISLAKYFQNALLLHPTHHPPTLQQSLAHLLILLF